MSESILNPFVIPPKPKPAQMSRKVVFYKHTKSGRIMVGFPENYPVMKGIEKIVCNHADEVERYSEIMRKQEAERKERTEVEREMVEAPIRSEFRKELQHLAANARNQINKDFCLESLKKLDSLDDRGKTILESYMHVEAFEAGK